MNIKMLSKAKSYLLASFLATYSISTLANEEIEPIVDWERKQNAEQRLEVFGDDFLGDAIDPHTGSLVFNHTDINLPGNSSLAVALSRKRTTGFSYRDGVDAEFGDWTLSVPRLSVLSLDKKPWKGARCSQSTDSLLGIVNEGNGLDRAAVILTPNDYTNGIQLEAPGYGSQRVLDKRSISIWPTAAKKITLSNWYFTCSSASDGGEGFIGHAPNGHVYRFDKAYSLDAPKMGLMGASPRNRKYYILAATQVSDVNGNWVKYHYDGLNRLTSISANDGRNISINYSGTSKLIRSASTAQKTWRYSYQNNSFRPTDWMPEYFQPLRGSVLSAVEQPDGYKWLFDLSLMTGTSAPSGRSYCPKARRTVSLTHPYGATGTFVLKDTEHRHVFEQRTRRTEYCTNAEPEPGSGLPPFDNDVTTSTMAVIEKRVSGPAMKTATWTYQYESDQGPSRTSGADRTNWTKVSAPDAHFTYYHSWVGEPLGGKLLRKETRASASSAVVKLEEYTYLKEERVGDISRIGNNAEATPIHTTKVVTKQDGDTYTQEYGFNTSHISSAYSYASPIMTSIKSNVSTTARKTVTVYEHNKSKWVLSLPRKLTVNSRTVQENVYDSLGRKTSEKRNGALFATYGYHSDGSFHWAKDANNRAFYASNYKRGVPQKVTRANGTSVYQYVDDFGRISSIIDANGNKVDYHRDSMGRLRTVDLPDSWASVTHSYNFGGTPTHTITKANAQTTITYDAMFRPVLVATKDLLTNKTTYVNSDYDSAGRETFMSFPSTNASSQSGIAKEYDSLSRLKKSRETVYPYAQKLTSYHSQHRRTETDALGHQTHYYHYGYDGAAYQDVKAIHSPLGLKTLINKNVWGEIISINQSGNQGGFVSNTGGSGGGSSGGGSSGGGSSGGGSSGGGSSGGGLIPKNPGDKIIKPPGIDLPGFETFASVSPSNSSSDSTSGVSFTRYYYYNGQRRLCRISQADVGDTLYQYDASGWLTAYQKGANQGTNCLTPSGNGKVTLIRDDVGRITKRDFAHSATPDITKTYDPNGNVKTVNRGGVDWTYSYNSINLPTSETLAIDGRQYSLGYGYNSAGQMASMTYPTGKTITYNPDGLGRPRQANWGGNYYANNIQYHANGQISQLLYGNGHTFQQSLNARQLPERLLTTKGGIKALDLTYRYDKRQLITSVTDGAVSGNNRTMGYDALERLTSASGPWGSGQFSYDSLGNILTKNIGSRRVSLSYSSDNRLIRANDTGGLGGNTGDRSFSYDSRGNTITAGNLNFTYDYADQPVSMHGDESGSYRYDGNLKRVRAQVAGKTIYNVYNLAGQLVHIDNVSSGKRTDYVSAGKMTIARVINNAPTYVHHDNVGSPVSGTNSSGSIAWRERYTPFGITLDNSSANNDQAGYTGHIKDSDTGLVYMQARYYDPVIGRFYSNDPIGWTPKNPVMSFNRYLYVNNNPYKYTDPDGEFLWHAVGAAVAGGINALAQGYSKGFDNIDYSQVAVAAVVGATGVGLAESIAGSVAQAGLAGASAVAANVAGNSVAGAALGLGSTLTNAAVDGLQGDTDGTFTGEQLEKSVKDGAIFGAAGAVAGELITKGVKAASGAFGNSGTVNGLGRTVAEAGADVLGNAADAKNAALENKDK
ncbi:hypothetical protein J7384_03725 [Endozoicomonas sp. G2_1]|uniref:RHS repeat domain-containing protein n=1 Tax=Endozoicomonas sp. G2_1 TaxID=2821091 RepID=UPI001AD9F5F5|nr:RHS repeat-associated core domain-containing protein [Endozoicomonas sp. G2_1]MBO9489465.1 hypothetical protein [Endozoicomonas sp. G2_1]